MPIERKPPSPHEMTRFRVEGLPQERKEQHAQKPLDLNQMRPRKVRKVLQRDQILAGLIEGAVKSGGRKDFGGGVDVQIFQDGRGKPLAKITHTYRNWIGITRKTELLVDHTGHKIA